MKKVKVRNNIVAEFDTHHKMDDVGFNARQRIKTLVNSISPNIGCYENEQIIQEINLLTNLIKSIKYFDIQTEQWITEHHEEKYNAYCEADNSMVIGNFTIYQLGEDEDNSNNE